MSDVESGIRTGDADGPPAPTAPVSGGLHDVTAGHRPSLEVVRGADERIVARLLPDGMYRLTHRADADAEEYELYTPDPVLVRDIVFAWIDRDPWWCDRVAWSRIDPAVAELESLRGEMTELLTGFDVFGAVTDAMDDAIARAGELLADPDDDLAGTPEPAYDAGAEDDDPFARLDALLAQDPDSYGEGE